MHLNISAALWRWLLFVLLISHLIFWIIILLVIFIKIAFPLPNVIVIKAVCIHLVFSFTGHRNYTFSIKKKKISHGYMTFSILSLIESMLRVGRPKFTCIIKSCNNLRGHSSSWAQCWKRNIAVPPPFSIQYSCLTRGWFSGARFVFGWSRFLLSESSPLVGLTASETSPHCTRN